MARIKITCDSTADLSPELYEKYDIDTVPLYIILDNETYKDSVDIQPDDIFAFVDQTGKLPKPQPVLFRIILNYLIAMRMNSMQ